MGLQLPGELIDVLAMVGFSWPEADEEKLFELARSWMSLAGKLRGQVAEANGAAATVWSGNLGETVTAFQRAWQAADSPATRLDGGALGAEIVGLGLLVCAGVVLALKINVIVQAVILAIQIAQAVATAVVTFGASLLEIPLFRIITKMILDQLLNMAIELVLNG